MVDPLLVLQLVLRYLHIFGAIALFGGSMYAWFALVPTLATMNDAERVKLHEKLRHRWKWVVHIASTCLLLSGLANLALASQYQFDGAFSKLYNPLGGIKFLLGLPVVYFAMMLTGSSKTAKNFQAKAPFWLTINMILATIIVLIGGVMRYIPRQLKGPAPAPAAVVEPAESNVHS